MKILSFVIPAYNSRDFLEKCVSSMIVPEVRDCLEILIVNDGSTDDTAAIAETLRMQYPDVIRVLTQENRGHGGAINTGCAAARGRYLKVIDADDWVNTQALSAFTEHLKTCESDVILTHHHTVNIQTGKTESWKSYPKAFGTVISLAEVNSHWRDYVRSMRFHGITYRTEFYRQHTPGMPERVFYEDNFYATYPCCHAKTLEALDLFLYEYRIGDVHQSVAAANQLKRIGHTQTVLRNMTGYYLELPEGAGKRYAAMKIQGLLLSFLTTTLLVNPDRKAGRITAEKEMDQYRTDAPEVYALANRKYQVFLLLNRLHISKAVWDSILNSTLYNKLRKNNICSISQHPRWCGFHGNV